MTRAQMEAARERVAEELEERLPMTWHKMTAGGRSSLCSALVTAVLGHPNGKVPKTPRAKQPGRGARLRLAR